MELMLATDCWRESCPHTRPIPMTFSDVRDADAVESLRPRQLERELVVVGCCCREATEAQPRRVPEQLEVATTSLVRILPAVPLDVGDVRHLLEGATQAVSPATVQDSHLEILMAGEGTVRNSVGIDSEGMVAGAPKAVEELLSLAKGRPWRA